MSSAEYVELHAHTAFSFLDGASQPDELAEQAALLGYGAFAVTDHDGLSGVLEFGHAARAAGLRSLTGAELTVTDDLQRIAHVTVLARTQEGYRNLSRLITRAHAPRVQHPTMSADEIVGSWLTVPPGRIPNQAPRTRGTAERPDPLVPLADLVAHGTGLTVLTGCARHGLLIADVAAGRPEHAVSMVRMLQVGLGAEHVYVELQLPQQRGDIARNRALCQIADLAGAPVVATGDVHAHTPLRARLHELLVAVRTNTTMEAAERDRAGNLALALRSPEAHGAPIRDHPDAVANTLRIAETIEFDVTEDLGYRYPDVTKDRRRFPELAQWNDSNTALRDLCLLALRERYDGSARCWLPEARVRLDEELQVIAHHQLSGFFLLHWHVLELAREAALQIRGPQSARNVNPPGRGRGSSVESIVCYLAGLSHIDPVASRCKTGRFLNMDLTDITPDIDLDFSRDIRFELLRRVVDRYGADRCAMVAAHATYRTRGAIRDVGAALGLPGAELQRIATTCDSWNARHIGECVTHTGPRWDAFRVLTREIADLPRQIGQHSGGVVIATAPLSEVVPIQPAAMRGRQICQWDKDSCADAGFLKIDVLGLGMLSAVEACAESIAQAQGSAPDLSRIDFDDAEVYGEIQRGETIGVFQIESRAQMQSIKRVRPENLHDLAIQVALVRPGPILGQGANAFVTLREARRRDPNAQPKYDHPLLEPVLADTHGAIVFQDQVIEVAMALAGFDAGQADGLRRAMTRRRSADAIERYRDEFLVGAESRGVSPEVADAVFGKLTGFSSYGFPRAHSMAFGLLAYQSAWLRHHFPAHFFASLMDAQPMGFYSPDTLMRDAAKLGVRGLPVDVNESLALTRVIEEDAATDTTPAIRLSLSTVQGIGYPDAQRLETERTAHGPFTSLEDLVRRAPLRQDQLEQLVMVGAAESLGAHRRKQLWQLGTIARPRGDQDALELDAPEAPRLEQLTLWDEVLADFRATGMSVRGHPVEMLRPLLPQGTLTSEAVTRAPHRSTVEFVGAVLARQRPGTAKGIVFLLLEDETGHVNVIVQQDVYTASRLVVRGEPIVRIRGRVERHDLVVNVIAERIVRLPPELLRRAPRVIAAKNFA